MVVCALCRAAHLSRARSGSRVAGTATPTRVLNELLQDPVRADRPVCHAPSASRLHLTTDLGINLFSNTRSRGAAKISEVLPRPLPLCATLANTMCHIRGRETWVGMEKNSITRPQSQRYSEGGRSYYDTIERKLRNTRTLFRSEGLCRVELIQLRPCV